MQKEQLITEISTVIVDAVNLHHVNKSDITADTSLRNGGLELDSVDILEVIVSIEQRFGVKVADAEVGKKYFRTIGGIADFVISARADGAHDLDSKGTS